MSSRAPPALPGYAELHCRTNFSFLSGASHPEELVARAQALRYAALAITDECSLSGAVRAHIEAKRLGMHLIVGAEMALAPAVAAAAASEPGPRLVLLAMSRRGYGNLVQWITVARRRSPKGQYQALMSDLEGKVPSAPTLAGLPDCLALLLAPPVLDTPYPFKTLYAQALWLKTWFGDRAAIALPRLRQPHDALLAELVQQVAALTGVPVVAVGSALMHLRSRKPLLDALTATRLRCSVVQAGHALQPNAEAHLRSRARLAALYRPEWLAQTLVLAGRCAFSLDELRYNTRARSRPMATPPRAGCGT